jgi:hypothetical protein
MKTIIHAKCIDEKIRLALYGMMEYSATRLFPHHKKNISIKCHLGHYDYEGEAMIEEGTRIKNPRDFKIVIDPYRIRVDDWGRVLDYSEWTSMILRTLAHEMIHVKQYIKGELTFRRGQMCWKKNIVDISTEDDYYCAPHEIEAYGKEKWLQLGYTRVWNRILLEEEKKKKKKEENDTRRDTEDPSRA